MLVTRVLRVRGPLDIAVHGRMTMSAAARGQQPACPKGGLLQRVDGWLKRKPVLGSAVVMGIKAWLADLLIQCAVEKRDSIDTQRSVLFATFGTTYQGVFQYLMYNRGFEVWFPGRGLRNVVTKIALTNLVSDPVFFFPAFYTMREAMGGERGAGAWDTVSRALDKYRANCVTDWRNSWAIWVPAHIVTYGFCPVHLRISWMASVSFAYVMLLSFTRGSIAEDDGSDKLLQRQQPGEHSTESSGAGAGD